MMRVAVLFALWPVIAMAQTGDAPKPAEPAKPAAATPPAPTAPSPMMPRVKMVTSLGDITLELDGDKAPISTLNFVKYAEDKFYDETIFHRVMKTFMIQGGGYTAEIDEKKTGLRPSIKNEWKNGLKNARGTISMARLGGQVDSATAQFFINVVDNARLDAPQSDGAAYAVFGKVIEGMDTVDKIRDTAVKSNAKYSGGDVVPVETVLIKSVAVVGSYDKAGIEKKVGEAEAAAATATKAAAEAAKVAAEKAKEASAAKMTETTKKVEEETKLKATTTESGLVFFDLKVGEGEQPSGTAKIEVHYTVWLTDGTPVDSSLDKGTPYPLDMKDGVIVSSVIKGWKEGVATMKVGGKRKLIVPPHLAWGDKGFGGKIGPNAVTVFEIEMLAIKK